MIIAERTVSGLKSVKIRAVIHRACQCGQSNNGTWAWNRCPRCNRTGISNDAGVVAFWHRNPLVRLWHYITHGGKP